MPCCTCACACVCRIEHHSTRAGRRARERNRRGTGEAQERHASRHRRGTRGGGKETRQDGDGDGDAGDVAVVAHQVQPKARQRDALIQNHSCPTLEAAGHVQTASELGSVRGGVGEGGCGNCWLRGTASVGHSVGQAANRTHTRSDSVGQAANRTHQDKQDAHGSSKTREGT